MEKIEFQTSCYDPQIDFIKGVCIIFVILTHCMSRSELGTILFPFWGDTAVPIFLIIQTFHYYKKGVFIRMPNFLKLWKRILQPFILMVAFMFLTQFFIYYNVTEGRFSPLFYWDMRGPGSYYIFIYLEFAFAFPLFALLFKKVSRKKQFITFVILSQLIEFICSITHCPDYIYRVLFFRYIFLIFLGYLLATKRLELNKFTVLGSITSIILLYIFNYTELDLEPFFYTSIDNWQYSHWICYIYIAYPFLWFLKYIYQKFSSCHKLLSIINNIGKYSYEIYLFQIFYYATISIYVMKVLSIIENYPLQKILYIVLSTIVCIIPMAYKERGRLICKNKIKTLVSR